MWVTSRAEFNTITDNRIYTDANGASGNDSMQIDLPNGGTDIVTGNMLEKGLHSENPRFIAFGEEPANGVGALWTNSSLLAENNTFVNDYGAHAVAIWNDSGLPVVTASHNELWNLPITFGSAGTQIAFSAPLAPGSTRNVELSARPVLSTEHPWRIAGLS